MNQEFAGSRPALGANKIMTKKKEKLHKILYKYGDVGIPLRTLAQEAGCSHQFVSLEMKALGFKKRYGIKKPRKCTYCKKVKLESEFLARKFEECRECRRQIKKDFWCPHLQIKECVKCGKSDSKHKAYGICNRCYCLEDYYKNQKKRIATTQRWKENNRERVNEYHRQYEANKRKKLRKTI